MENNTESCERRVYYVYSHFEPDTKICMYLPCHYFLSDLDKGGLYFTKRKGFIDIRENELPIGILFPISAVGENVPPQQVDNKETQRRIELFRKYSSCGELLTSCWTLREEENYFMWYVYSHKFGVRIMTTIERLVTSIRTNDYEVYCGKIMYSNRFDLNHLEPNLFTKQTYYSDEREFRFFLLPTNDMVKEEDEDGSSIPLDWNALEPEVLLSPFLAKSCLSEKLQELESRYNFLKNVKPSKIKIKL
ncbi:MAG: hypothetical protein IKH35_00975 [Prevotella sp.]|nr:hypothetical protein [Prevotella sp.]